MIINFNQTITDLEDKEIPSNEGFLTLKEVCVNALLTTLRDPVTKDLEDLSGVVKVQNAILAEKIYKSDKDLEISVEEATLLKTRIGQAFIPIIVMKAWRKLDK